MASAFAAAATLPAISSEEAGVGRVAIPDGLPGGVRPEAAAASMEGRRATSVGSGASSSPFEPRAPVARTGLWTGLRELLSRFLGPSPAARPAPLLPAEIAAAVARAVVHELSLPNVEAALLGSRAPRAMVRPTIATVAFARRARHAWQKATRTQVPTERARLVAEGTAWAERATRAARALQRALPPASQSDRAVRALLRTGLGALQEPDPVLPASIDAMLQVERSVRGLAAQHGVSILDPLGPSGRGDVPGFLARVDSERQRKTVLAVLVFALPVVAFGLLYLAAAG